MLTRLYIGQGIAFLISLLFSVSCFSVSPKHEIRALWLTTNWGLDWPSSSAATPADEKARRQELCRMLDCAEKTGLNTIFFQVRLRGDVLYASRYEPWSRLLTGQTGRAPGYDPLSFMIEACHRRNLQCHAWFVCMPVGNDRQVRQQGPLSIVRRHPEWCKKVNGEWYLDPGLPEVRQYLTDLVSEITEKYPVDGIHLDYIRYPDRADRFPDQQTYREYHTDNRSLREWRTENINRTVYAVYDKVKSIKPWVKVSCSVLGKYNALPLYPSHGWSGTERVHQDAREWMKQKKIDFIVPMLYYDNENFYPFLYDWIRHSYGVPVVCGLGIYRLEKNEGDWSRSDIFRQILAGRSWGAGGQALYRGRSVLENTKNLTAGLRENIYEFPALFPSVRTPDSIPPPASPSGLRIDEKSGVRTLSWRATGNADTYILYGSPFYPVDTGNPENILSCNLQDTVCTVPSNNTCGQPLFFYAVTATDRYHQESVPTTIRIPEKRLQPFR